jgi:hypothetical protein
MQKERKALKRRLLLFPPWFLTKEVREQIEALLPYHYHMRFRLYFDRYGCVRCERKNAMYACSGLCMHCLGLVSDRLKRGDKIMEKQYRKARVPAEHFLKRRESAIGLLADLKELI